GLVAAGGLVRATGSGLGCPSWPGCHPGRFFPPLERHALIEWSHRTLVIAVTILIALTAVTAWRRYRSAPRIWVPSFAAGGLVVFQAILGAIVVDGDLKPALVTAHFATAMLLVGVLVYATVGSFRARRSALASEPAVSREFASLATITAASVGVLLLVGAYVRGLGAGLAFADWPLMGGRLLPEAGRLATPHFVHRLLALVVGLLVMTLGWRARRRERPEAAIRALSLAAAGLYLGQVVAGALNVWTGLSTAAVVAHVTLSALTWGAVLALAAVARNLSVPVAQAADGARGPAIAGRPRGIGATASAYVRLTKPRIIVLLLITTVPTMVVAAGGWPGWWLTIATLAGGTLAAGGANAINCFVDRDIDARMGRTATRPIPSGAIEPGRALEFGIALGIAAFAFLWATVNLLAAALAMAALLFYVFVYTIGLKRSTPQNIVIGGAAGAVPVLVGWAAVTGTLTWAPVVMFAIVFFWTPPHFWALSIRFAKDYERAGVPMLPVVAGLAETRRQILRYSFVLVAVTLLLHPVGRMGALYLAAAAALGAWFIRAAAALQRRATGAAAMSLFRYSINYLALLFVAMALDVAVRA
ncbi:MAG: heme o synthase, partial [Actinomycetota bacterium]